METSRDRDQSAERPRTNRDAGGSRTHESRVAAGRLAVWLQRRDGWNVLARSRTWSPTFAESCANPSHSEDVSLARCLAPSCLAVKRRVMPARIHPPPGNRTRPCGFEDRRAPDTLAGNSASPHLIPPPGVEPGLRLSESRVRFRHTPRASITHRVVRQTIRHTITQQQGRKDLNPVRKFWNLPALPGAHPCRWTD